MPETVLRQWEEILRTDLFHIFLKVSLLSYWHISLYSLPGIWLSSQVIHMNVVSDDLCS